MTIFRKFTVEWMRDYNNARNLIWCVPNENFPRITEIKEIVVKEHERGVLISSGVIKRYLTPGKYAVPSDITDVVWIDISPKNLPFGVPKSSNALVTTDGRNLGISGTITLRVKGDEMGIKLFLTKIVAGQKSYSCDQLINRLRLGPLTSVFHDIVSKMKSDEFARINRSELNDKVLAKLSEELPDYGIEATSVHIVGVAGL